MTKKKPLLSGRKQLAQEKVASIPIKVPETVSIPRKPSWIRARAHSGTRVQQIKRILREGRLHTVCEEASCPNLGECFSAGTATFMIMGDICTRRCPFCDVAHGYPLPLDEAEPDALARTVQTMGLDYVVITSVNRDDLRDGGARHFVRCIQAIRNLAPTTRIEILVPDFRNRVTLALDLLSEAPADVFNHNLETVPELYQQVRPGADYQGSLALLQAVKEKLPQIPTKSGIMLGLGEDEPQIMQVLHDLRQVDCKRLTLGQYLQPSRHHLPVARYLNPDEFTAWGKRAKALGFEHVASAPLVRSSYKAEAADTCSKT